MSEYDPNIRTRTLARVAGPYFVIMGLTLAVNTSLMALILPAFMQDRPLVLATGAFTLILGLVVIAAHHHWANAAAIAVSMIGWAAAIKGAWLMIVPETGAALTALIVRTPPLLLLCAVLVVLLGAWLSFIGWGAKKESAR
jgi:hypothetical protein